MDVELANVAEERLDWFNRNDVTVSVMRLDKVHPLISGNKWFKLRNYLEDAIQLHKKTIITFGGAWSNHIVATAAACSKFGLSSIGIIRGEADSDSVTLQIARGLGMQLNFVTRDEYRRKIIPAQVSLNDAYVIPEGGFGPAGAAGAESILNHSTNDFTHYCCAVGTGTTLAGLVNAAEQPREVIGISVLKNNVDLEKQVALLLKQEHAPWRIIHQYHFGGYAKHSALLIDFMNKLYAETAIPTDFVYTGKLFFAVADMIKNNFFPPYSKILIIHSGGLQGNGSLGKGTLIY